MKRLFIDRSFKQDSETPEENENPDDYSFIFATVEDNTDLMKSSPGYVSMLSNLPENIRRAHRYGDWDALAGNYFPEFSRATHTVAPFQLPKHWRRYRALDYGLDCLAVGWFAVDEEGHSYMYRELKESGLIVQEAAKRILDMTLPDEHIEITFAPPDMWSRQKDTGKTMAEIFMLCGVPIVRADNNRVQGHLQIKEQLAKMPDGRPGLVFFNTIKETTSDLEDIQADEKNPSDCAKEPHEITHTCVVGDTLIKTPAGDVPIQDLREPGICYAWDGERVVTRRHGGSVVTNESADVYELELDNGQKIAATADHPVLTAAGWKTVGALSCDDDILCVSSFF